MPSILGANSVSGYDVSNSIYINRSAGGRLAKTFSSGQTDRQKNTVSMWVKRCRLTTGSGTGHQVLFSNQDNDQIGFDGETDQLRFVSAGTMKVRTNRVFRDTAAWYHIVFAMDTTQGTGSNRIKFYVNGVQETSFQTYTDVNQNTNHSFFIQQDHDIGRSHSDANRHYDGYICEMHGIDGKQLDASYFGETNDNGVWVPKKYTGTYGNNGFFLQFKQTGTSADASGKGADTSGNGHHFDDTSIDVEDIKTDTCTNNFATLIDAPNMNVRVGNLKAETSRTGNWDGVHSSIGVTSGKWYYEVKASRTEDNFRVIGGVVGNPENFTILFNGKGASGDPLSTFSNTYPFYGKGVWLSHWYDEDYNDSSTASVQSNNDILQFALDMDNYKLWIGINGQFKDNSNNNVSYSDVAAGNSATVTIASGAYTGKTFFPAVALRDDEGADDNIAQINFGNPSFSISSGNSDGLYGNFEYAVPSGFYALCTKRLATYG